MCDKIQTSLYVPGKMSVVIQAICNNFDLDGKRVNAFLKVNFPELYNKAKCSNCGGSMKIYPCTINFYTAELLVEMANVVYDKLNTGVYFTEANKVHRNIITTRKGYTTASQFTIAAKLGLITKVLVKNGNKMVHDQRAGWLITSRGFDFLANKKVPKTVYVFQNKIVERDIQYTTISDIYRENSRDFVPVKSLLMNFSNHINNLTLF